MLMTFDRIRSRLLGLSRAGKLAVMFAADAVALPCCLVAAYCLRLGADTPVHQYEVVALVIMALMTIPVFYLCGLYRNVIRFVDLSLLRSAGLGLALSCLGAYALSFLFNKWLPPRGSLFIYWFIAFAYVVLSRFGARHLLRTTQSGPQDKRQRIAIYGAGEAGVQLLQAFRASQMYAPACFIDDNPQLHHTRVAGLEVLAPQNLAGPLNKYGVEKIVLAMPSASPERRQQILDQLTPLDLGIQTLPPLSELISGQISERAVRNIEVADLLGRQAVPPDRTLFAQCVKDKTVLVTGAGGSIGSELCRQILSQKPEHLILLDHSEFALYTIEHELRERAKDLRVRLSAVLASVCDRNQLDTLLSEYRVQTIYHAAAYKHVPMVEANAGAGIRNNVEGTLTVGLSAGYHEVETCVLISTDKAVRPTNVMGASKRISELIFQALAKRPGFEKTTFSMVRFGNVIGSSGSVVPLFRRQIENGDPITLTHPDIVRYFMLISEAAQLVIQAGAMAHGGDVFVLDMGNPVRIIELARKMIRLAGLRERTAEQPDGDIDIQITGLRPGEKLYEELLINGAAQPSKHPRIMTTKETMVPWEQLKPMLLALQTACDSRDGQRIREALHAIVPEYTPANTRINGHSDPSTGPKTTPTKLPSGSRTTITQNNATYA